MATVVATPERDLNIRTIPIEQLHESKTNPRRHFAGLGDLTASVQQHGVLTPLLARPVEPVGKGDPRTQYEIVAGARRYRAAIKAGLAAVPVRILVLSDEQALEFQVIENLQREDVHPLDEALGYDALLKSGKNDVAAIAAKVNKSESYVYQRLKLAALIPKAQKAFIEETITAGHAILIARLQPNQQTEALEACFEWNDMTVPVRELGRWIEQNVHLDLNSVPFPKNDKELLPKAGSCVECPKRTGFAPALFPEVKKKDTCTDPECFHAKQAAFVQLTIQQNETKGVELVRLAEDWNPKDKSLVSRDIWQNFQHKPAKCESAVKGIIVSGVEQGKIITYCPDKKCKTHGARVREAVRSSAAGSARSKAELGRDRKRRENLKLRQRIFRATVEAESYKRKDEEIRAITLWAADRLDHDHAKALCEAMGWDVKVKHGYRDFRAELRKHLRAMKTADLQAWILWITVAAEDLWFWAGGSIPKARLLNQCAKRAGVKVAAIAKQLAEEKSKKRAPAAAKAKKGVCRVCGCTEAKACKILFHLGSGKAGFRACSWMDGKTKTLCTNPKCLKAAKVQTSANAIAAD